MDCFVAEPVMGAHSRDPLARNDGKRALLRHCLRQTRSVCARERSDEAIHLSFRGRMDCFAALAMTERRGLLRGACRACIRATRWLAMTENTRRLRQGPRPRCGEPLQLHEPMQLQSWGR